MAERVTQQIVEVSGTGQTSAERVTQQIVEVSGTGQIPYVRVTQLYTEVAALYLIDIISFTTVPSAAQVFTTGGAVALVAPDIPIVGVAVVPSAAQVFTPGLVKQGIPITGVAVVPSAAQVFTSGTLTQGIPIIGSTTIASGAAVNSGGQATLGLYTITPGITSQIALMTLGVIDLGQVLGSQGIIDIQGPFVGGTIPSTAQVFTSGVVGNGIPIIGGATVPTSASVFTGGVVGSGLNLIGSVTIPSAKAVFTTGGAVVIQIGIPILGNVPVPSTKQVFTGGALAGLGIFGSTTIPSTAQAYAGGVVSGIPSFFGGQTTGQWSGRGMAQMVVRPVNQWDEALEEEKRIASLVVQALIEEGDTVSQRGLAGLGVLDAQSSSIPSQLTLSRRNFFERGKLLTPADGGAADHTVLQFDVPTGYFGVLLGYYCQYMGTGFVQGSGDIIFRLKAGNAWVRNMGNLQFTVGDFSNTFSMPLLTIMSSDDTLTFQVNVPNTSGLIQVGTSYIMCGLQGWLYPMAAFNQIRKC